MGVESYITFQPPVAPPATPGLAPFAMPTPVTELGWLSIWFQPPVPPRPRIVAPPTAMPLPSDFEYAVFPYIQPSVQPAALTHRPFDYIATQNIVGLPAAPPKLDVPFTPPAAVCNYTVADLRAWLWDLLDDDGTYYTTAEILNALNKAQRLFAFLTLCIERTATFTLTNGQAWHTISSQISDFLCPLRVTHVNSSTRLRSDTVHNLDLRDVTWRARAGNPTRYAQMGFDLLAVTPQPASGSHTLALTYAAEPAVLTGSTSIPEIPFDQQSLLVDFAFWYLRLKEGSQELANAVQYLNRFLDGAKKYGQFVRSKSQAQTYDVYPFDLASFDRGRFDIKIKRQSDWAKKQQEMQGNADNKS